MDFRNGSGQHVQGTGIMGGVSWFGVRVWRGMGSDY